MRLLALLLWAVFLFGSEQKSQIEIKGISYNDYDDEVVLEGKYDYKTRFREITIEAAAELFYSSEYDSRRYLDLNRLTLAKEYEDYMVLAGKIIRFQGEMEGYNITDIYNRKNYLADPFGKGKKIGSWGVFVSRYFDESTATFGAKLSEEKEKYPKSDEPYNLLPLKYSEDLKTEKSKNLATVYLEYSFNTEEVESENKIAVVHGYDSKRYLVVNGSGTLNQYAYRVNKLLFLSHIVSGENIYKFEGAVTDVLSDETVRDYGQYSIGLERLLGNIKGKEVTLYTEYYGYVYNEEKTENMDISELYDNDLFMALRINVQDVRSSEIKGGVLYDLFSKEQLLKIEGKTRIQNGLILKGEYIDVEAKEDSPVTELGSHTRAFVGLDYTF